MAGAIRQIDDIRCRNIDGPVAVSISLGGVSHRAQLNGNGGSFRHIDCFTADVKTGTRLSGVDFVIAGDRVDGHAAQRTVNGEVFTVNSRVTGYIGDGYLNGCRAVQQRLQGGCRNADTPCAAGQHRGLIINAADGHSDDLSGFHVSGGAADGLRVGTFRAV